MAKQRYVNTRFWSDNFIVGLKPLEKYLFLYFLTNEHTSICGIYELPIQTIEYETGLKRTDLARMLKSLAGKISYIDGWVWVRNFERHQVARGSEKVKIGILNEKKNVPGDILEKINKLSQKQIGYTYPIDSISALDSDSDSDLDSDTTVAARAAPGKKSNNRTWELVEYFFSLKEWPMNNGIAKRYLRASKDLLQACDGNVDLAKEKILKVKEWAGLKVLDWSLETVLKRWFELDSEVGASKRAYIDGDPAYQNANGDWMVILKDGRHVKWVGSLTEIKYV